MARLTTVPFADWFLDRLRAARAPVLMTHIDPDADGLGSQLAFVEAARQAGVDARIVNADPVPRAYQWLDPQGLICHWQARGAAMEGADLGLFFDVSESARVGAPAEALRAAGVPIMVLDHHPVAEDSTVIGAVDPSYSSTGELCFDLLEALGWRVDAKVAHGLYAAMSFDTGSFRFLRNRGRTLRVAGHLLDTGLDANPIQEALFASRPAAEAILLGRILSRLRFAADGRIAWVAVPPELFDGLDLAPGATGEAMPHVIGVEGVLAAAIFKPGRAPGQWKVSLRSKTAVRIGQIARNLGGGGHDHAAGATMEGDLDDICQQIVGEMVSAVGAITS